MNGFGKETKRIMLHGMFTWILIIPFLSANSEGEEAVQDFLRKYNEKTRPKNDDNLLMDESKSDEKIMTDESSDDIDSIDDSIQSIDSQM